MTDLQLGKLTFKPLEQAYELVAPVVADFARQHQSYCKNLQVVAIDPELSDTAAFCEKYNIGLDISANCIVVEAKRADRVWYAACLVLATDMADINNVVRRQLDARKISFAPMDTTLKLTNMEYGGVTPVGLPDDWPILVDQKIMDKKWVIIGGGVRSSKLAIKPEDLAKIPGVTVAALAK